MLTAIVTTSNDGSLQVRLTSHPAGRVSAEEGEKPEGTPPNPISPAMNELYWAGGSFLLLAVLMRVVLYPRLRTGMDARYAGIRGDLEGADKVRADAQSDVAEYDKAIASVRAEAAGRLDAARQKVDAERNTRLAEVNSRVAAARAEADQRNAAAREAAKGQVAAAVAQVASRAAELATGRAPDAQMVQQAVQAAMQSGGSR